ncbi:MULTISPECIES: MFS transporter [unclassified Ekhidna]|jgi:MFS family permease|uniref:MFS transporter n=1 Tax=unclassified Ekhidna TaxID=2632188 RepID=UPI0032DFA636
MKKYSLNFWLLSLSSFLFFGSFNMVLPELPDFMRTFGGEDYIGLHITFFTLTALISRPFSGKLTDTWGRLPVMIFGCVVTAVVSLFYPFFLNIYAFLFIRFLHGFSTGFKPTGTAAYVADIVPIDRRGEGMGILSFFGMTGMGIGNYVGGVIAIHYDINVLFYSSAGVAILSVLTIMGMKETVENKQRFSGGLLKITRKDIYEPTVLVPSIVMMLVTFSFGTALTLIPDFSLHVGVNNKGLYMFYFTMTSLVSRVVGGRLSDEFGRRRILQAATLIIAAGSVYTGFSVNSFHFLTGALIFGAGYGLSSPALFAWAADLAPDKFRGRGFSTLFMALEIGIGMGAMLAGQIYNGNPANFPIVFGGCGGLAFLAFVYLLFKGR